MLFDTGGVVVFVVAYKDIGARGEVRAWWRSMRVTVMTRRENVLGAILSCEMFDASMPGCRVTDY